MLNLVTVMLLSTCSTTSVVTRLIPTGLSLFCRALASWFKHATIVYKFADSGQSSEYQAYRTALVQKSLKRTFNHGLDLKAPTV